MRAFSGYDKTRSQARSEERRVLFARLQERATYSGSQLKPSTKADPKLKGNFRLNNGLELLEEMGLFCLADSAVTMHPTSPAGKFKKQVPGVQPEDDAAGGQQVSDIDALLPVGTTTVRG